MCPKQGQVVTLILFSSQGPTRRPCYFCGSELQTGKRLYVSTACNGHAPESLGSRGGKRRVFSDVTNINLLKKKIQSNSISFSPPPLLLLRALNGFPNWIILFTKNNTQMENKPGLWDGGGAGRQKEGEPSARAAGSSSWSPSQKLC